MTAGRAQAHPYPHSRRFCASGGRMALTGFARSLWLAQGSYAVQLRFRAVLVLPNFARCSHHSDVSGDVEHFLFSTHKASVLKLLVFCAKIYNFFEKTKFMAYFFTFFTYSPLGR